MKNFLKQLCNTLVALVLALTLLAPIAIRLSHALTEHQEQLCIDKSSVHLHEVELDCDFLKYQQFPQYYPNFTNFQEIVYVFEKENTENHYTYLSQYQKLHFTLRGPPSAS